MSLGVGGMDVYWSPSCIFQVADHAPEIFMYVVVLALSVGLYLVDDACVSTSILYKGDVVHGTN